MLTYFSKFEQKHVFLSPFMKELSLAAGANAEHTEQCSDCVLSLFVNHLLLVPC